ncbi:MAG TPA: hypothetical protein DIS76_07560 [Rhodospirillaceae bacterium]|nr:hypothetical protein [Rhodospirillaceae bacterium]
MLDQYGNSPNLSKSSGNNITREPQSPDEYKYFIMARMIAEAERLAKRSNWQFPNQQPPQNGLAYVYGGKDPQRRIAAGCCPKLNGLDCSGLISMCAQNAEISVSHGASAQKEPSSWTINPSWGVTMEKLPGSSALEKGDIVYWKTVQTGGAHIGLVQGEYIIQSNGKYVQNCDQSGAAECVRNYSIKRGPNKWPISTAVRAFGNPTAVLRLSLTPQVIPEGIYYTRDTHPWVGAIHLDYQLRNLNWAYNEHIGEPTYHYHNIIYRSKIDSPIDSGSMLTLDFESSQTLLPNGKIGFHPTIPPRPQQINLKLTNKGNGIIEAELVDPENLEWMMGPKKYNYYFGARQKLEKNSKPIQAFGPKL